MDGLDIAPLLDVVKIVKQLFNGSTSIEPYFTEWRQITQDVDSGYDEADEQAHFDSLQITLHGGEVEENRDRRHEKERKEKQEREERKKKEKGEKEERKKKRKEEKKQRKEKEKEEKKEKKGQKKMLKEAERAKREGLTAALAFMHSRGMSKHSLKSSLVFTKYIAGIPALFQFDIDGDIGDDPNALTLWFGQPDLGLPSKEYYGEKEIRDLYRTTIEKMLLTIMEAEEAEAKTGLKFPPWPWPPWGDDDKKSENKTTKAARLSRQVLKFESDIAAATADLCVSFLPS